MSRGTPREFLTLVFAVLTLVHSGAAATPAVPTVTASAAGRGFTSVSLLDSATSWIANPAFASPGAANVLSLQHARWYGLPELPSQGAYARLSFLPAVVSVARFGGGLYRETALALASAWRSGNLRAGMAARFGQTAIARYGEHHGVALDLGIAYAASQLLLLNITGRNLLAWGDQPWTDGLTRSLSLALTGQVSTRGAVSAEIVKDPLFPTEARIGVEFAPFRALVLRAGVTVGPARTSLGLRFSHRGLLLDYAFVRHSVLGDTHFVGLTFAWSH